MGAYGLFDVFGIELEYMIVDKSSMKVKPVADSLLRDLSGVNVCEYAEDGIGYSNELVKHVIELKTDGPTESLSGLSAKFHNGIRKVNDILQKDGGCLMPTAMHPFMNPEAETVLWEGENRDIYSTYDRIFNCKGHGWSNLQSMHINLPFKNDVEFGRLHAAIRAVLPLIPALTSSSPFADGKLTGIMDNRLFYYMQNQKSVPSVAGLIVPERVYTEDEYKKIIYEKMQQDIKELDTENVLDPVWLNSRGAIARFDRGAIEIRVIDIQECSSADIAAAWLVVQAIRLLCDERWTYLKKTASLKEEALKNILIDTARFAGTAEVSNRDFLKVFGLSKEITGKDFWVYILKNVKENPPEDLADYVNLLVDKGTLAERISHAGRKNIKKTYEKLMECLDENRMF